MRNRVIAGEILSLPGRCQGIQTEHLFGTCISSVAFSAMVTGLPCIATKIGGVPEIFDANCGVLVPSQDENALVESMLAVARDTTGELAKTAQNARQEALAKYDHSADTKELEKRYEAGYKAALGTSVLANGVNKT